MTDNKTQKSVDYWSRKLTGESHLCTFPYDVRKNHQLRHRLLELVTKFPGPSQQHTEAHYDSRNNDEHLYNFLITVLTILLHKYTGLDDITLGMPILKKTGNPDCPNTTLPLSIQLPQDASFADAYSLACETVTEASDHQEEPVDAESYFDVMTALENCHAEKCIRSIRTTKCDIIFLFNLTAAPDENSRHLQLTLLYDSNLYKSTTIQRLLFHYSRLALSVGADETIRIADMDCLFPNEKKQILETFNFTDYHYPQDSTISQLFEARVKREPERPAVVADDGSPTYEQLNRKAHRLAAGLQRYGVKPDTIIALMIPRSAALITAQLGIMKAGGAFLSIDSQMPEDRIRFILEDCGADILLVYGNEKENEKIGTNETGPEKTGTTGSANEKNNPLSFFNGHIINIKPMVQQEEAGIETDTARAPAITSDNLAYVIYTSGTTGKPKGVLVPHRGIASLTSTFKQLHVTPADRILEFASCSFDASIWEIYMALLTGASSYVVPSEVVEDYDRFAEYLNYHRITIASLPPIYADHLENYEFPHLRVLITAGSAPGIHLVNTWREKLTYFNGYGPTETTICSSLWKAPQRGKAIDTVLIGSPIRNLRIYILDKYMNPVPPGAPGELCIAGESVVRGYLNRPGLTAEKFITNPFSHRISSAVNHAKYNRMYKTGDLGRWLDDGTIEFLGRVDLQINIRGFRVEPGEIEEVIRCHHHITEVTVQALENPDGDVFLCAYMECHPKTEPGEIRALTAHKLPDYMIPTHFIAVEKIPLNTSGKVDKKALPKPSFGTDRDDYSPPSTATEKQLTEIWGEVLSLPTHTIGIDSDFFHLGGHSLKATIMSAKIHKAFNVKIPLSAIFQLLTIRRLAGEIDHTETVAYATVETAETKEYYPLSSPQKRLFILWQMEKESTEYNIQMLDIHEGALNRQRVEDAFKQLIARHDALRTSFLLVDGRGRQKVHIDVPFEMEYQEAVESRSGKDRRIKARQAVVEAAAEKEDRRAPGATFDLPPDSPRHVEHIVKDFVRPFDLSRLPLFRVGLVNVRNSRHVLMLDMHHIISDGISMGIIEREFQQLYDGAVLPAPKHKYVDFAQWQNRAGAKDIIKEQEQFWLDRFSRRIPLLNLPIDFVRPAVRSTDGDTIQFKIHETLTHRLNQLAHDNGTTLYMVLLTAYNILLHKLSGQEDVVVGTVTAGRKHIDLYPIIGMFANTLALRNYPRASATVTELLTDIRTLTLEAFENQDYPFEELAAKTAKRTDTGRNPLFDVTFSLENETEQDDELLEVVIPGKPKAYSFENKKAKFDVSLTAVETEEGLRFSFEYGTRLFKKDTIYRFCEYLKTVLEIVADEQSTPVYQIDMLPDSEKELLLHRFNNTAAPCPHEKTIHQLFEEQALRRPNLPAILGIDAARADEPAESVPLKAVTYDQLNREANQLANRLLTKGVTPGTIIAMCTPRSTQMIVGILGILKAGAAYLPIDPQYPEQRIKYLLSDSNAQLTVTAGTFHEDLFKHTAMIHLAGTPEIFTESGQAEKERENLTNSAFTPAYIIYTSGTTGRPKGVIIEHRQAVNTLTCRRDRYKLGPAVTALQLFSYAFDAFVASFFSPIISGAKVLLASDRLLQDITRLKEMIIKHHVSHFISIPQLFKTLLDLFEPGEADCLQTVTLAGDTFPVNLLELAAQKAPRLEIAQEYGVTESAVMSTMQRHQEKEPHITIGSPTWNTRIFIIDAHDNPQPFGVPGELCIASAGNARGYLNKPELTAEKFTAIPKHLQKHENSQSRATAGADTFYRTGDLARWLPDGKLQFLGRIDRQAKIRGFRIETGEIEGRLLSHHAVKEAVVAIKEDRQGEKYLCAYYVNLPTTCPELWPSVAEFFIYDELLYYAMTHDERRNDSYKAAIRQLVKDKIVVEIGTGQDAILSRFCVEAGVKQVYALEMLDESYQKAKKKIKSLGMEDKITLIHGDATKIELPEKADVLLHEIVGSIGGSEGCTVILNNTRHFLKENAVMIPTKTITKMAAMYLPPELHANPRFAGVPGKYTEKVFNSFGFPFDLRLCIRNFPNENIISNDDLFEDLDYSGPCPGPVPPETTEPIHFVINKKAKMDGFAIWLTLETIQGEVIDILEHEYCWLPMYAPVFYPGVEVNPGDEVVGTCKRYLCENGINPSFTLEGLLKRKGKADVAFCYDMPHFEKRFREHPFYKKVFAEDWQSHIEDFSAGPGADGLREYLGRHLPAYMVPPHFVPLETLPLTANGKIDMNALPEPDTGGVDRQYEPPRTSTEKLLVDIWEQVLGVESAGIGDDFFQLGGDSIKAIRIAAALKKNNWIREINHLFLHKTIKTLVEYLKPAGGRQDRQPKQDAVSGPVPKTPIHHWFFRQAFADKSHFNQWVMLSNDKGYDENILQIVFRALTDHHDGLRLRCRDVAGRMILENLSPGDNSFALSSFDMQSINTHTDGPHSQPEEHKGFQGEPPLGAPRVGAAGGTQAQQLHLAMDLEKGPLVQVGLFKFYSGHRLLISIHHLVMDGVSWRILLEDFQTAYTQAEGKAAIRLPAKSHSFQHWARAQRLFAKSSPLLKELPYWRQIPHSSPRETPFDSLREAAAGARTFADDAVVKMVLPAGLTGALLKKVNHAYNTRINDILLTALAGAVKSWCGVSQLTVNLEGHGREPIVEDIDNHRTIGWFTTQYPVHLVSPQGDDGVGSRLKTIKEILRRVPRNGIGYGILKHLTPAATLGGPRPDAHPHISFNYLGQFSIGEGTVMGDSISSNFEKPHALHVEGILIDNSLTIAFHYHKHEFKAETMERLRDFYREQLEDIIQHCSSRETTELTPSDLGYAALSLAAFDVIRKGINNNSEEDMKTEALYPMTPVQKAMFAASSANPRAYFVQNLLALPASVDTAVLEKSFNVLIKRHAVLRTVFKQAGDTGTPIQVVPDKGRLTVNEENLASLAAGEREERLKRLLKEDRERGFDLSVACPMRMTLVRTGETENTLIWTLHHILMDGWCFGLILNQWRDVYDALAAGQLPADVAPVPFRRYIDWLEQQDTGPGEAYWSQYLEHCRPTRFTSAADVKNKGTYQLEEHYFTLDSSLTAALNRTASGNRVTLYTLFQVLWGILLNSHTQNEDVLFGSVVSGRSDSVEGIEQIIGLLINLIPVRLRVNGLTTFPELLEEVQKQALQSRAHDRLPLADLLAAASLPPHSIDTIMIFENYQADSPPEAKADSIREKGLHSVRWLGNHEQWEYDFCVYVIPGPELTLRFSYNASVFTQAFVAQLADQFKQLAELANKATGVLTVSESGKPGKRKTGGMLYANTSIFYDLDPRQMMTEDIPFYLRYAQEQGGDILELACGTGRITMPLVEAGNSVWAVDLSKTMMARLEEKVKGLEPAAAQRIHTSIQNMATFSFNKKFPLIFISFRSFQAMHTEKQQLECLRNVYKHLADDGRFIISFLRPVEGMESRWINLEEVLSWENIEPRSGNKVRCYLIRTDIDPRRQMIYADQVYYIESADGNVERMVDNMALRYDYVDKIKMLLSSTGFKIEREMGHYDGRPLEEGIDYIFVCQKK